MVGHLTAASSCQTSRCARCGRLAPSPWGLVFWKSGSRLSMQPFSTLTSAASARSRSCEMRGGLESLAKCAIAASIVSNTSGGLPTGGRAPPPSSRASPLSTTTRREILSGKFAAKDMDSRPEAECPTTTRPLPLQLGDDREHVAHVGVDRIILARGPAGFAEAALVEARHLAVARKRFGDADPIVGVEVVGAVHEQDGRSPARAEGAVEDRYVAGIHPSVALHGWRLLVRACEFVTSPRAPHAAARAGVLSVRPRPRFRGGEFQRGPTAS